MTPLPKKDQAASNAGLNERRQPGSIWLLVVVIGVMLLMITQYLLFPLSTMEGSRWRYLIFPPLIVALFLMAGARYAQHVYSLNHLNSGFGLLLARLFLTNLPTLVVAEGKIQISAVGEENLLHLVGGPGYLIVMPGSLALLEGLDGDLRVVSAGRHFVTAQEVVKETISLEERHDHVDRVTAVTRDGIEVAARDIHYRYRLYGGEDAVSAARTPDNLFMYSDEGLINLVYNRSMSARGLSDWHAGVRSVVEGVISDFIRQNQVDHLTAPDPAAEDPRGEVYRLYNDEGGKKRFREKGAELLWIDIGHFELPEKVAGQRVDVWQARWAGEARLQRAQGEAQRSLHREMGRAEAQAEMLTNIARSLEELRDKGEDHPNRHTLYLAGIAQLLESLGKGGLSLPPETK